MTDRSERLRRLSVFKLTEAYRNLELLRDEVRARLSPIAGVTGGDDLEVRENEMWERLFGNWLVHVCGSDVSAGGETVLLQVLTEPMMERLEAYKARLASKGYRIRLISEKKRFEGQRAVWIAVDVNTVQEMVPAVTSLLKLLEKGFSRDTEMAKSAVAWVWERVVLLPLVKGRSLNLSVYSFPVALLQTDSPSSRPETLTVYASSLEPGAMAPVELWSSHDLHASISAIASARDAFILLNCLNDTMSRGDPDESGSEVFAYYVQRTLLTAASMLRSSSEVLTQIGPQYGYPSDAEGRKIIDSVNDLSEALQNLRADEWQAFCSSLPGVEAFVESLAETAAALIRISESLVAEVVGAISQSE